PPVGAWITYNVATAIPAAEKLVLTISDNSGKQVRRCELDRSAGLRRFVWNLNGDPVAAPAGGRGGPGAGGGRGGGGGGRGGAPPAAARPDSATATPATPAAPAMTACTGGGG